MIFKNAEIYNAAYIKTDKDNNTTWLRAPQKVYNMLESEGGPRLLRGSTGVEIRFVINSGDAVIRMKSLSDKAVNAQFHIFRGAVQGGYEDHEHNTSVPTEFTDFVIKKSNNIPVLQAITDEMGSEFSPEVVRVIFDRGEICISDIQGDIMPPTPEQLPKKTLLCYGSSITHGSNSIDTSHSWPSLIAANLNMDLRNLGMAGSCAMEPEMIDYIASEGELGKWDIAIMELGINVLAWKEDKIYERVTNAIEQVAMRNSSKQIYIISPFYCNNDFNKQPEADRWRKIIKEITTKLALPNVTYINGLDILGRFSLLSADEVHPNIYGVQQIADRLINIINK